MKLLLFRVMTWCRFTLVPALAMCPLVCWQTAASAQTIAAAPEPANAVHTASWTVMMYMNGDNNLEAEALADFLEMAKIGSSSGVNIVVQLDRAEGEASGYGDWTQTLRYRVTKNMKPTVSSAVEDIGEANMGDGQVLKAFVDWSKQKYPAQHYALVIWDHGQGWRVSLQNQLLLASLNTLSAAQLSQMSFLKTLDLGPRIVRPDSPVRSVSNDDTNHDVLYNREMQDALVDEDLDLIGFDACLMGMVETAYALRNVSKVMIGSEELEPGYGWQYDDWLPHLIAQPAMDARQLGKEIVDSYARVYGVDGPLDDNTTTLAAIDLAKVEPVAAAITAMADELQSKLGSELTAIKAARQACPVYAPRPFQGDLRDYFQHVDIAQFSMVVADGVHGTELRTKAHAVQQTIADAVIERFAGSKRQGAFGSYGLAIYFPLNKSTYDSDPYEEGGYKKDNTVYPVEFVQTQHWADFLHAYFAVVP